MSVANDIAVMVERLRRADIPLDNLCYQLDELHWQEFMRHLEGFSRYTGRDLSYAEDVMYMGMMVRKRTR